ncbi:MAG: 4-(cytidine 5'-diphospho)-2-C-methyl-D-erythritol kinase [Kiritimatiellae bacterium]|nr:4-(cytidine 5'-diphospho)-2-C-methyl-D-erythritol kinase [Kiritimatiellia bacterium]
MRVRAHAKINWTLEVLGKRPDGYHDLRSIVLPVALHDVIDLEPADGIVCKTEGLDVPQEKNLAYRAAIALRDATGCTQGVSISIEKHIPSGAGLGGGSSDAAAVLNALNVMWNLNLSCERLCEIAALIGSDIPALVMGGPVLMEGRGEVVRRIDADVLRELGVETLPAVDSIEVFCPGVFSSTPDVYREFKESDCGLGPNDLQPAALRLYPEIAEALAYLEGKGLKRVTMSGSGSAVYGVKAL